MITGGRVGSNVKSSGVRSRKANARVVPALYQRRMYGFR
uniref:Uncharacterized protein n=1 Tax=Rhizophora mucronata TaxID=61149 RepID=A0A2P2QCI3_RHIMU